MKHQKRPFIYVTLLIFLSFTLVFSGCENEMPLSSLSSDGSANHDNPGKVVLTDSGPIHILSVTTEFQPLLKGKRGKHGGKNDSVFHAKKFIKANRGGDVKVGSRDKGYSKIKFKKHDLAQNDTISFTWAASNTLEGMLNGMVFGPHGLQFKKPVEIELSYKMADLNGVNEKKLRIYYFNEDTGLWELVGGKVDKRKKVVKVKINHFSRYALAHS